MSNQKGSSIEDHRVMFSKTHTIEANLNRLFDHILRFKDIILTVFTMAVQVNVHGILPCLPTNQSINLRAMLIWPGIWGKLSAVNQPASSISVSSSVISPPA